VLAVLGPAELMDEHAPAGRGALWRGPSPRALARARADLALARARRLRLGARAHPGSDASVAGEEDTPRYDEAQLARLEREGKAFRKRNGTYGWGCADRRDLLNCLKEWNPDVPEALVVKAFLKPRAIVMGLERELPRSWQLSAPKPVAQ
jgi:hypothetical protein